MSAGTTDQLLRELARDLPPVKRQLSLRLALAVAAAIWASEIFYVLVLSAAPSVRSATSGSPIAGLSTLQVLSALALVLAAVGGTVSTLASATPGREGLRNRAAAVAAAGLVLGMLSGLAGLIRFGFMEGSPPAADLSCFIHAAGYAILPAAVVIVAAVRGWVGQPLIAGAVAIVGAAAFGAVAAQLACPAVGARHLLFGHLLVPVVLTGTGAIPLAALLHRIAR